MRQRVINIQPQPYREGTSSIITHYGMLYSVDKMLAICEKKGPPTAVPLFYFDYFLNEKRMGLDEDRVRRVDTDYPIIYIAEPVLNSLAIRYVPVDGIHRLVKTNRKGLKRIYGHRLTMQELDQCRAARRSAFDLITNS